MGHPRPLFRLFPVFTNKQTEYFLQKIKKLQYPLLGFEPMNSWIESPAVTTRLGRAPAQHELNFQNELNWMKSNFWNKNTVQWGSCFVSVGRAVASNARGLRFDSSHWQNLYWTLFTVNCIENMKIKKKEAGHGPFFKNAVLSLSNIDID